ncbi:MAG: hypothetical protein ABJN69_07610 [Hellea sp.]
MRMSSRLLKSDLALISASLLTAILITSCNSSADKPKSKTDTKIPNTETVVTAPDDTSIQYFSSTAYQVPFDLKSGPLPNNSQEVTKLARFAWKEFIALNWPSTYDSEASPANYQRATPDTSKSVLDFAAPDNKGKLVWQTYKHRNEVYPMMNAGGEYPNSAKQFDVAPNYTYPAVHGSTVPECGAYDPTTGTWATNSSTTLADIHHFNNLDETSEIDLATLFTDGDPNAPGIKPSEGTPLYMGLPQQPRRFIYEAKANRTMFDYVSNAQYYDNDTRTQAQLDTYTAVRDQGMGGLSTCPDDSIICFPHGIAPSQTSDGQEGTILVKATWKQLTQTEYSSGRYLTAPIIRYRNSNPNFDPSSPQPFCFETIAAEPTSTSLPYGLVGLHIIHKTTNYPTYIFATFEQVDNLSSTSSLFYYNRNDNPPVGTSRQAVEHRAHPIPQEVKDVTDNVHFQLRKVLQANSKTDSVWFNYQLIGVQGQATNSGFATSESEFALANIVTETNGVLQDFVGTLNADGTIDPHNSNIFKGSEKFIGGGCKGCHGNAQVGPHVEFGAAPPPASSLRASDFSFITQNAPFEGKPDAINQPLLKTETN